MPKPGEAWRRVRHRSEPSDQSVGPHDASSDDVHPVRTHGIPPRGSGELITIQYARALAAVLVVINHLGPQFLRMGFSPPMWDGLAGGVDIFFVISGVIMWVTTSDRAISPGAFLRKRFTRIVPLYWIVTSFTVILMLLLPQALQTGKSNGFHIIASYAFIAWLHPTTGHFEPVVIPGWTLNYEMFFYMIFSLSLLLRRTIRLWVASSTLLALAVAGALLHVPDQSRISFYTSPLLLEFAFGMGLGEIYVATRQLDRLGASLGLAIAAVGLGLLLTGPDLFPGWPRFLLSGVPALAIVTGLLAIDVVGPVRRNAVLLLLGDASYSLYLFHPLIISAISQGWRKLHLDRLPFGIILFSVISVTACCCFASFAFRFIEVPLIGYFRRRSEPR